MSHSSVSSLLDSQGRNFHYLRLSITEACNFRCLYCLPNGYRREKNAESELSLSEIANLTEAFARLGFWKVRLTGGEPTLRRDVTDIAASIARVPGIRRVAISTNGYRLAQLAPELKAAGVSAVNVSLDSLDPSRFREISGRSCQSDIVSGIQAALRAGFDAVKVNAVLLKGLNDVDIGTLIDWTRDTPLSVRFIELMRTGGNSELYSERYLSGGHVQLLLLSKGWTARAREAGDGPAMEFTHPRHQGRVGIIAPYSSDFCRSCNRLRMSSKGKLRLCLFGESDYSLRPWMQERGQIGALAERIRELIYRKPPSHYLHEGNYGNTSNLAAIGG